MTTRISLGIICDVLHFVMLGYPAGGEQIETLGNLQSVGFLAGGDMGEERAIRATRSQCPECFAMVEMRLDRAATTLRMDGGVYVVPPGMVESLIPVTCMCGWAGVACLAERVG